MREVPDVNGAERIEAAMDSARGKLLWTMGKVFMTVFMGVCATLAVNYLASISRRLDAEATVNTSQDRDMALVKQRIDGMQKVSDATVASLQALTQSVLNNHDDIIRLQQSDAERVQRSRPGH